MQIFTKLLETERQNFQGTILTIYLKYWMQIFGSSYGTDGTRSRDIFFELFFETAKMAISALVK
jgi:hypothetical protein